MSWVTARCHELQKEQERAGLELIALRQQVSNDGLALRSSAAGRSELQQIQGRISALVEQMAQRDEKLEAVTCRRQAQMSAVNDAKVRLGLVQQGEHTPCTCSWTMHSDLQMLTRGALAGKKDLEDKVVQRQRALEDFDADIKAGESLCRGKDFLLQHQNPKYPDPEYDGEAVKALTEGLLVAKSTEMKALLLFWRCKKPLKVSRATLRELIFELQLSKLPSICSRTPSLLSPCARESSAHQHAADACRHREYSIRKLAGEPV